MTSSVGSMMSNISVSVFGEEMDLEKALDEVFKQLQGYLNDCHSTVRNLAMCEDRNDDQIEILQIWRSLNVSIDEAMILFKELKSISKQVVPKCPPHLKAEVEALKKKWIAEDIQRKQEKKNKIEANKALSTAAEQ